MVSFEFLISIILHLLLYPSFKFVDCEFVTNLFTFVHSLLADWVFHGSYLLASWFFSISTLTTSLPVEQLISVQCLQLSCQLLVL